MWCTLQSCLPVQNKRCTCSHVTCYKFSTIWIMQYGSEINHRDTATGSHTWRQLLFWKKMSCLRWDDIHVHVYGIPCRCSANWATKAAQPGKPKPLKFMQRQRQINRVTLSTTTMHVHVHVCSYFESVHTCVCVTNNQEKCPFSGCHKVLTWSRKHFATFSTSSPACFRAGKKWLHRDKDRDTEWA